jgi:hypothetical protein
MRRATVITDHRFIALNREAELAKRLTCSGLTALGKATPSQPGIYYDAFFGISIGLERLAKLAWLIDECITRNGTFPTDEDLKAIGHNIGALLDKANTVRAKHNFISPTLPCDPISISLIEFLSNFAKATRYFNIDVIVGGKSIGLGDPVKSWHEKVGAAILATPRIKAKERRWQKKAASIGRVLSPAVAFGVDASGTLLTSVASLSFSQQQAQEINEQAKRKLLAIVRFLASLAIDLAETARDAGSTFIPYLREHFGFFCEEDAIIGGYKKWPPRGVS